MYSDYGYGTAYAGMLALFALFGFLIIAVVYVLGSLFYMKIFEKAGVQGKWRAWVPIYNNMIFLKLGDMSPWLILYAMGGAILLSWLPVIGQIISLAAGVLMVLAAYRVGQKLQKEGAWVVLYIFLSLIWLGINAFDKSRWNAQIAPAPWAGNAFFADRTVWDGVPVQPSAAPAAGAAPGYGAPQQGGYPQPGQPVQGGYPQQPAPGYQPPAAPSTPPAAPSAPVTPPPAPSTPPAAPSTPPTTPPPAAPPAPPAPPADPNQPPA